MNSPSHSAKPLASQFPAALQDILELCREMNAQQNLPALFALIAREAARILEAERSTIFLLDRERSELWSQVALGEESIRFDSRLGIAGAVVLTGKSINTQDAQADPRFYSGVDGHTNYHTQNILAVPLRASGGDIIGTLEILNKHTGPFSKSDEAIAQILADQAALALDTTQKIQSLQEAQEQLRQENTHLLQEVESRFATQNIIGTSEKIQRVIRVIDQIRETTLDVLITGENGTGKELVAKALHFNSPRAKGPFIALNCAALPEHLVESELFGIEKGVATGVDPRSGKFEEAQDGTLFLDEIGDLGPAAQAKVLRVLQERTLVRVGGQTNIRVNVRILAATNKNLEKALKSGTFREDLYYRLKVIHIHIPALREVPEDVPILTHHFLAKYCNEYQKNPKRFSPQALHHLKAYLWPGNIRQLENEIKRLVITVRPTVITEEDLEQEIRYSNPIGDPAPLHPIRTLHQTVAEVEQRMIRDALQACGYNQVQTAKLIGLSRVGLIRKMKRYGIGKN